MVVEFGERCNVNEVETCDGVSEMKKKFIGVSKRGNKWLARVRDPKLRTDVHCGCYSTPEEAALAVKMKKLELEEMYKGVDFRDQFKGVKLPYGVRCENGRWRVRIWNPKLKYHPSFGSYKTCEEAAAVAERKRVEFRGLQKPECEEVAVVTKKRKVECRGLEEHENKQTGDVKVPRGVRRVKSGKWVARIRDPMTKSRIWLGTYDNVDEAIRSFNKRKDLLAAKMTRAEFDGSEIREMDNPGSKTNEGSVKFECEQHGYDSPNLLLGAKNFNNVADSKESRRRVLDSSVFDAESSNSASVSDKTCGLDFDRAVGLGFIDEYGQLQGEFSKFDDPMWCAADEIAHQETTELKSDDLCSKQVCEI